MLLLLVVGCAAPEVSGTDAKEGSLQASAAEPADDCPTSLWYPDLDQDGFGGEAAAVEACDPPPGYQAGGGDCDDTNDAIHPDATETCDGEDQDCDDEIDDGYVDFDDDGLPDCGETQAYCTGFDGVLDWAYWGEGEWAVQDGTLTESRGGLYAGVAWPAIDFDRFDRYRMEVTTSFTGSLNDFAGLAFALDPDQHSYLAVRWDDPNDDYDRFRPPGAIDVVDCLNDTDCSVLAADDSARLQVPADGTQVTWSAEIDRDQVTVIFRGDVVFDQAVPGVENRGPGIVGLYSNDNDGGIYYDDYCLWVFQE